jgi:hypothetical protein
MNVTEVINGRYMDGENGVNNFVSARKPLDEAVCFLTEKIG